MDKTELNKKMFELFNKYHKTGNIKPKIKAKAKTKQKTKSNDFEMGI